jgi:hypothetical protein
MAEHEHEPKSPVDQLLDLVVYAPLGLLMNLDELLPQLVEKGHQQVAMARMFGKFAVDTGGKEARKRIDLVTEQVSDLVRPAPAPAPARSAPASGRPAPTASRPTPAAAAASVDAASLGIPDYDALSASQVVPRLAGLGATELEAVRAYEAANRGRKTILSKIAQLQG